MLKKPKHPRLSSRDGLFFGGWIDPWISWKTVVV
jgi:hypothetical protein